MGYSPEEIETARTSYQWKDVHKDIALSTKLTVMETDVFGEPYMKHTGMHPYDIVELVYDFFKEPGTEARKFQRAIVRAFEMGKRYQDESN